MSDKLPRKSLVDYSKISDRPVQDARFLKTTTATIIKGPAPFPQPQSTSEASAVQPARMSSQMDAVVRLMTGREERTIADKFADANRPTWEQYKKENHDKLNLEGIDEKKMEEYRRQLDSERDQLLARASSSGRDMQRKKKKRRKSDSDDDDDDDGEGSTSDSDSGSSEHRHKRRRKHKKKHKKKRKRHHRRDDDSHSSESDTKRRRKKRDKRKRQEDANGDEESDGSHYKLSKFFSQGSQNDS